MPSFARRLDGAANEPAAPSPPVCVRSRSLLPLDVHPSSQAVMQRSPQNISQSYPTSSFPLDPALRGHTVAPLSRGSHTHSGFQGIPTTPVDPTSVSRLAVLPPQFQQHGHGGAIRLLSHPQYVHGVDPRMDPHMLRRAHSDYGPAMSSHPGDQQVIYNYHQLAAANQAGQSIGWTAREVILHSPSLPRQRSAKACKKCRKRKTKCSGGQPCTRCTVRGLECEYDEKSSSKGPSKARIDTRKKPSKTGSNASRTSSRSESRDEKASAKPLSFPHDKIPSVMQPPPGGRQSGTSTSNTQATPSSQPTYSFVASPLDGGSIHLGDLNPSYAQYIANETGTTGTRAPATSADAAAAASTPLIQGYSVLGHGEPAIVSASVLDGAQWQNASGGFDSDNSDGSRPPSACSDYSSSTSSNSQSPTDPSFAFSAPGIQAMGWPAPVPGYSFAGSIPHALSASSSSSSLKDALLERPPARLSSSHHTAAADSLTHMSSHSSLSLSGSEPGCCPDTPSMLPSALSASPTMCSDHAAFILDDMFNFSPEHHTALSPSGSYVLVDVGDCDVTVRARGSQQSLAQQVAFGVDMTTGFSSSTSTSDFETPRAGDVFQFDGPFNMGAAVYS